MDQKQTHSRRNPMWYSLPIVLSVASLPFFLFFFHHIFSLLSCPLLSSPLLSKWGKLISLHSWCFFYHFSLDLMDWISLFSFSPLFGLLLLLFYRLSSMQQHVPPHRAPGRLAPFSYVCGSSLLGLRTRIAKIFQRVNPRYYPPMHCGAHPWILHQYASLP